MRAFAALLATIALGLASRRWPVLGSAPGDVLYATAAYFGLRWLAPRQPMIHTALTALAFATAIEVSQLWHPAWLDAMRDTRLGGLVLGHGFLWSDLGWYVAGVLLGAAVDRGVQDFLGPEEP